VDSLDNFLNFHIERLTADEEAPVNLRTIAAKIGAVVEEREMVPEAVMAVIDGRFHIYLQSNFKNMHGAALRERFSLAHEIGHTLFYEDRDGDLKARTDAPKGDKLEIACQRAASMILIPNKVLRNELRQRDVPNAAAIIDFANRFEVSIEAMVRRLQEFGCYENDWAPVLTRRKGQAFAIEYAAYPPWLRSHVRKPQIGAKFATWFSATDTSDGIFKRNVPNGMLEARPFDVTRSKTIFEVRYVAILDSKQAVSSARAST
jgi:Zn-dependent peptidase ImmA (M78 family)